MQFQLIRLIRQKNISKIILLLVAIIICLIVLLGIHTQPESYKLIPINSTNWSNIINDGEKTFVYVGRESCEQCSAFKPMLEAIVEDNKIKFYYFDTDINENIKDEIIKRYNIIAVPSIVVLVKDDFYIIMDSDNDVIIDEILNTI